MIQFDPSTTISSDFGIFGIPATEKESQIILLPVPWEVTTSYGSGASYGPVMVRRASEQIDLFDLETGKSYESGYFMRPYPNDWKEKNDVFKAKAQKVIALKTEMSKDLKTIGELTQEVNSACDEMTAWVRAQSDSILGQGKILGLVGGDHSTPFGAIQAVSKKMSGDFGVLHIDAHADLRNSYQGFKQSHASIMFNVMTHELKPKKLVQVGIRDFCEEEYDFIQSRSDIKTFFDLELKRKLLSGSTWAQLCQDIVAELPKNVYVSFDIDGLDPVFCPHTGTPVPGGLSVDQLFFLFETLVKSGRKIVSFDLNEVSTGGLHPDEADDWDGNVGARVLYKLCGWTVISQKLT
jgi:agmatinase